MGKWFAGSPFGNPKKNPKKILQENFVDIFFGNVKRNSTIFFIKRVAKDIDPTRVKRIELTNKDRIRSYLEREAHFPQESPSFLQVLRKTILDYFLPFPPPPPLEDPRNIFPENKKGSQRQQVLSLVQTHRHIDNKHTYLMPQTPLKTPSNTPENTQTQNKEVTELIPIIGHNNTHT